ncbi:unnamed protein product [Protopolystoma xenopodis]|uniref:Uncharacterized protein n=1 Tax=Protopolystoma xenopodis TaxID=117903 RepID=A0A448X0B2_9PLAT|nr:unnamed protein product [Protopolystoma xenopodis]
MVEASLFGKDDKPTKSRKTLMTDAIQFRVESCGLAPQMLPTGEMVPAVNQLMKNKHSKLLFQVG